MQSLFRKLTYDKLPQVKINGKILDLGGGKKSGYHKLIKGEHQIYSVNIDAASQPDFTFNLEEKFPVADGSYDGILCLNVLEHIFNYQNVADESFRILKEGGLFVGSTPFIFNVHESPNDYFRYTKTALEKIFKAAGFGDINIEEIGTGVFGAVNQLKFGLYKFDFLRRITMFFAVLADKILKKIKPNSFVTEKNMPLGYFIIAKKS